MGRTSKIVIKESLTELELLLKKEKKYRIKLRLKALLFSKSQKFKTQSALSDHLGIALSTLKRWFNQYQEKGITSLLSLNSGGNKKSLITEPIHKALSDRLTSSTDPFRGYWDVQNWIRDNYDLDLNYNTVRTYLIRHFKTKLKTPRKSHYKKNEEAIEAFFKTPRTI